MSDPKYDVFLSFRGEDTRGNFTSHLYAELCRKKIETFIDNRLGRGEEISPALYKAIEESKIYVIILSEHYASSSWCLDELTEILKCKDIYGREVIPVFYKVDPSNVRHHQRFGDKVDAWKASLTQVAGLSGWDSEKTRPESTLVTEIVEDILKKLSSCFLSDYEGKPGIDMHIEQIQSLLLLELPNVRITGIWGMGGIGKTTIASAVFEKLTTQFSYKIIILNVQQEIERVGLDHVKSKYLSQLLGEDIKSSENNFSFDPRLKRTTVLLVFDDVKDADQLKDLIGTHSNFGQGSRIIVTSRNQQVLQNANADNIYQGKGTDAIQCIFLNMKEIKKVQLHADTFKKMHNLRMIKFYNYFGNGSNVTFHAFLKSFPNDLKFLHWEYFPQRSLPKDFCPENLATLNMSYSDLEQLWEGIRRYAPARVCSGRGVQVLLLSGDRVRRSLALPNLKRLNLRYSKKLIAVPDLSFCPKIEEVILSGCVSLTQVNSSSFLNNLNLLFLDGCTELKSLKIHSNILSRSSGSVVLRDCHNLETLLISGRIDHVVLSHNFFYGYSKVEEMEAEIKLNHEGNYEIGESFLDTVPSINDTCLLDISKCKSLTCLPAELLNLKFLTEFSLRGCLKLEELPEIKETMENLKVLNLDKTAIKELPSSLLHLVGLQELSLQSCTKLKTIPSSIGNLSKLLKLNLAYCASLETFPNSIFKLKLTELNFEGCSMLQTFPEILESAESFAHINLTKTAIKELPSSLHLLVGLEILSLQSCRNLKTIPSSIGNLTKPFKLDLTYCESLETFPSSIFKLMVKRLDFEGCSMLRTFPEIPNDIGCLSSLTELSLQGSSIVNLPESLAHLSSLKSLNLSDCKLLECVPMLPPNLNQVLAFDCPSIKRMVLNSCSDPGEGTFKFHLTNSQELDATSLSNIVEEACIKINDDAYWSVVFCFPGGAVPCWFHYCCKGHSVTMKKVSPNLCSKNRLIGFALCALEA
ncbi:hypothetical protein TSUD_79080 [Trifolium subterraneum]|uniref:TIR domain-containing protein n=1 Tax=Trifolium subterraneum TaxID=3900 RepID=A0A2Z6LQW8_TRISU|nr:hypothetical protein TSUD_79080 [Trifolium subterraneum]